MFSELFYLMGISGILVTSHTALDLESDTKRSGLLGSSLYQDTNLLQSFLICKMGATPMSQSCGDLKKPET